MPMYKYINPLSWNKFSRMCCKETLDLCTDEYILVQPLFRDAHSNRERGVRHTLFFLSGRFRKQEPENLLVEVPIIPVDPNQAWLFSFWDFEETLYNMEQVWRSRQWGTCLWRAKRNTNDWNSSSTGRINCTPPVLLAWHRAWAVLDWSNEGPLWWSLRPAVCPLLESRVLCSQCPHKNVYHTWNDFAILKGVKFVLQSFFFPLDHPWHLYNFCFINYFSSVLQQLCFVIWACLLGTR